MDDVLGVGRPHGQHLRGHGGLRDGNVAFFTSLAPEASMMRCTCAQASCISGLVKQIIP